MYLLKYTSLNSEGYRLVHAENLESAIEKLKRELFFLTQLHITDCTIH